MYHDEDDTLDFSNDPDFDVDLDLLDGFDLPKDKDLDDELEDMDDMDSPKGGNPDTFSSEDVL